MSRAVTPAGCARGTAWRAVLAEPVRFEATESALGLEARAVVARMALALAVAPEGVRLVVEGHADPGGERELAAALGTRRAQSVIDALMEHGVDRATDGRRARRGSRARCGPRARRRVVAATAGWSFGWWAG